jgi:uncharacterized SAM-binding protein YcdF (DUF218 family)
MKTVFLSLLLLASMVSPACADGRLDRIVEPYDAIIVPGYPFRPNGKMNPMYKVRLYWAYHLYKEGKTKRIIVSGSAVHTPYVEAEVYALYLIELGIDPDHIIIEDRAEHSLENVFYSMEIAREHGFKRVAVVSDKAQTFMIKYLANKFDHEISADFLPAKWRFIIMNYWNKFDLDIDYEEAYQPGFVHISMKKTETQRKLGTSGHLWKPSDEVRWTYASNLMAKKKSHSN